MRPLRAGEWRETAGAEASRETEPLAKRRRVTSGRVGILRQLAEASGQLELFDSVARIGRILTLVITLNALKYVVRRGSGR